MVMEFLTYIDRSFVKTFTGTEVATLVLLKPTLHRE